VNKRFIGRSLAAVATAALAIATFAPSISRAQTSSVTITLAVQDNQRDQYTKIVTDFQAAYPNVLLQLVSQTQPNVASAATDVNNHLDAVQQTVSQADVVLVRSTDVSPEATRAGYYLNLQPLIDSDSTINVPDFIPTVYRAFQWDQGTWALPLTTDATVLSFDPAAFDKANLAYPTAKWTIDDLITAVKALTVVDSSGKIVTPGITLFAGNNDIPLYMSLIGKPLYDVNAIPNPPLIDQPETTALLDKLNDLFAIVPVQTQGDNAAPITIGSIRQLTFQRGNNAVRKGVLLPGGHSYLNVSGVAVSGSTQHPDQAYALARFLTNRVELASGGGSYPARTSLVSQVTTGLLGRLTPEVKTLYQDAIANGYSQTDRRFYDFLASAIRKMGTNSLDTKAAIAAAQSDALNAEQTALARKADASKVAVIATPVPTVDPKTGITLKFGMSVNGPTIPNKATIQALADQFAKDNAGTVGRVDIESIGGGFGGGNNVLTTATTGYDCFYLPYSAVPNVPLDSVLSLDSFLTSDKNYDSKDYLGAVLGQVTRDNKVWALPLGISPTVMWYDPLALGNAGVPKPAAGWTTADFKDGLKALAPNVQNGNPPFTSQGDVGSSLLMLTASYGGLPIDWRTTPVTVKFTDQANVDAMQQVLDLAKAKLIDYRALSTTLGLLPGLQGDPVYSQKLNGFNFGRGGQPSNTTAQNNKFVPVPFPKGPSIQVMAYTVGTLYISATAQNADACYRWISTFAQHPEILSLMPARNSQLADAKLETTAGVALATTYRDVGKILADPNTIAAPSLIGGFTNISSIVVEHWLFEAWDNYVLNGKDLNAGLTDAQNFANGYLQCAAVIPAYDASQGKYSDYQTKFLNCATTADPSLKARFGIGG